MQIFRLLFGRCFIISNSDVFNCCDLSNFVDKINEDPSKHISLGIWNLHSGRGQSHVISRVWIFLLKRFRDFEISRDSFQD